MSITENAHAGQRLRGFVTSGCRCARLRNEKPRPKPGKHFREKFRLTLGLATLTGLIAVLATLTGFVLPLLAGLLPAALLLLAGFIGIALVLLTRILLVWIIHNRS